MAEAALGEESRALPCVRKPDGELPNFDEIVTPHPVVAFLFRRRTFIVLLAVMALAVFARPTPVMLAIGFGLAIIGECWRLWAAGTIHKTEELITGGPYAYVRHPLYVGSFVHALAYGFMSGRWESFLVVLPLFGLLYGAAVATEEAMLYKIFGEQYADYCRRVPRFMPRPGPHGGHGSFDWERVVANKEYVNIVWMIVLCSLFVMRLAWSASNG